VSKPDFTITHTECEFWESNERNNGGLLISWTTKSAGFGTTTVFEDNEGVLRCDNECMSREFLLSVFEHVLQTVVLTDKEPKERNNDASNST